LKGKTVNNTYDTLLKIIIVHEDHISGIEAVAVLGRLAAGLDAEFGLKSDGWRIDSGVWKFEMLHDPELWELAVVEAVEADMIIISAGCAELPSRVRNWIESVLPMKVGGPAALVALLDLDHETYDEAPRLGACLRRLAEQSGLDFFCNADEQRSCIESGMESTISHSENNSAIWRSLHQTCLQRSSDANKRIVRNINKPKSEKPVS
jgi:hypothetical protein